MIRDKPAKHQDSKNRKPRRMGGYGKALQTPPEDREHLLAGETDRQAEQNRSEAVDPDEEYPGNVTGSYSQPVRIS